MKRQCKIINIRFFNFAIHFSQFRSGNTQRTNETLKALAEGLFSKTGLIEPESTPESKNLIEVLQSIQYLLLFMLIKRSWQLTLLE
jgi:hypothetical protein